MKGSQKKRKFIQKKHQAKPLAQASQTPKKSPNFFSSLAKTLSVYKADVILLLIPIFLFVIFITLIVVNNHFLQEINQSKISTLISSSKINPYPFVNEMPLLPLSAKAAIIIDTDSQVVIFSKNPNLRFPMASTVKIITALTALDYFNSNDVLTVKNSKVEGTVLNLYPGEQFYFEDLLYAMLLPSANDAATAIADNYPGGQVVFVAKMNEKAKILHLNDTHFADPTGLEDSGDYTTVIDMARLASAAVKNEKLAQVTSTKEKVISDTLGKQYYLTNLNKLLGINGVTGIKTGTTEGAKEVLVTSTIRKGHTFIVVVMNSEDRFGDTQKLLNLIDSNVQFIAPIQF